MSKKRMYDVPNPERQQISKSERQRQEKERLKSIRASLARSADELRRRQEAHPRSAIFSDGKHKGARSDQKRNAIKEVRDD